MLDTIRRLLRADTPPTAASLAEALDRIDARIADRQRHLADLADRRADAVLTSDAAVAKLRREMTEAAEEISDLTIGRSRLAERLANATQTEAEAGKKATFAAATAKREAAAKAVKARYPKLRSDLLALIREIAEADAAVAAANAALPAGAAPIAPVETFRDRPALAEEVVHVETTVRWVARSEFGNVDVDPTAAGFRDLGDGSAEFRIKAASAAFSRVGIADRITTTTRHVLPWQAGGSAARLATIRLPGIRAHDAAFEIDARFGIEPSDVLRAIDKATAETPEPAAKERVAVKRSDTVNDRPAGIASRAA